MLLFLLECYDFSAFPIGSIFCLILWSVGKDWTVVTSHTDVTSDESQQK